MVINYFGEGCFRLQSGDLSLLVDPVNSRLKGDIVVKTLIPAEFTFPRVGEGFFEISSPGEYEIRGVEVLGLLVKEESTDKFLKTIYRVKWDGIVFAFLGHISQFPAENILEELEEVEVLFLPVSSSQFFGAEEAVKLIKKIEPKLVLPSFVKSIAEIQKITSKKVQLQEKLVFRKKDLEEMREEFVVLEKVN